MIRSRVAALADTKASDDRLFRYDIRIAANALRAAFRWHERLMVVAVLAIGVVAIRSWMLDHSSQKMALWAAAGGGALIAIGCGRAIRARLSFHSADGPLAADALIAGSRRRYTAAWHLVAVALLTVLTMLFGPWMAGAALGGYAIGAVVTHGFNLPEPAVTPAWLPTSRVDTVRSWLRWPGAGLWTAALLIVLLALLRPLLSPDALLFAAGLGTVLSMLALTTVDDGIIRFMAIAGFGPWATVWRQARGGALFLTLAAPACAVVFGLTVGGVVGSIGVVALTLLMLRVLAYRLHGKRFADLLLYGLAGLLIFVAIAMPVLLPVLLAMILWPLQRRAAERTWLIA